MAAPTPEFNLPTLIVSRRATEVLAAHRCVIISTDTDYCEYPASQYDFVFGVTRHAAAAIGDPVDIIIQGVALVQVDGAAVNITQGLSLTNHDAAGYAQAVAGGAAARRECFAKALAASTADGDLIPALIAHHQAYYAS